MGEDKRNNILDNLSENEKRLYEILGIVGEIKSRINGSMALAQKVTECTGVPESNSVNSKVGKQTGMLVDIMEELRIIYECI